MLTSVNAYVRLSKDGIIEDSRIYDFENRVKSVTFNLNSGENIQMDLDDCFVTTHKVEDSNYNVEKLKDSMVDILYQDNNLETKDIKAVILNGMKHRVFNYKDMLLLHNEDDGACFECKLNAFLEFISSIDENYLLFGRKYKLL